ncbi:MAG: hypothetical protein IJL72_05095 [Lachnospiraceae bacterium]|nr:hypothetical protein [Lachnospiraceae bacterium]
MKHGIRRWFSILLTFVLLVGVIGLFPVSVRALSSQEVHVRITTWNADGTVSAYPGGTATVDLQYASPGDWVNVEVETWHDYRLAGVSWGDDAGDIYTDITESQCFQMWDLKEDVYVSVVFWHMSDADARRPLVVCSSFDENDLFQSGIDGGYAYTIPEEAMPGETVRVIAEPSPGYYISGIEWGNGVEMGTDITRFPQFNMWDKVSDPVVDVCFKKRSADDPEIDITANVTTQNENGVTIFSETGGTVEISQTTGQPGDLIYVSTYPYYGYRLEHLYWGDGYAIGTDIRDSGRFYVWGYDEDICIDAVFKKLGPDDPRRVNVVANTRDVNGDYVSELHGGYAYADVEEAVPGQRVTITAVPYYGYTVESIDWGNGAVIGTDITEEHSFLMWDDVGSVTVDVMFRQTGTVKPAFIEQPQRAVVQEGDTANFHVFANGPALSYKWQYKIRGTSTWRDCSSKTYGYNTPDLQVVGELYRDEYQYRCIASTNYGTETASDPAVLRVYEAGAAPQHVKVIVSGRDLDGDYVPGSDTGWGEVDKEYAFPGETVTVSAYPYWGYYLESIHWGDGELVGPDITDTKTFTMWDREEEVVVDITMREMADDGPRDLSTWILTRDLAGNDISEFETGGEIILSKTTAYPGETIHVTVVPYPGYRAYKKAVWGDGLTEGYEVSDDGTFLVWNKLKNICVVGYFQKLPETELKILKQPEDTAVLEWGTASFTVAAQGEDLHYQWQYKIKGTSSWHNCTANTEGFNTSNLRVQAAPSRDGYQYRCVVTDVLGDEVKTKAALLTVEENVARILTDPEDVSLQKGGTAWFMVTADGENLTYRWQYKIAGTGTWRNCSSKMQGYNTPELYVDATVERNGYQYRCVVTDGKGNEAKSAAATLTVRSVTIESGPFDVTITEGELAFFGVYTQGDDLTYRWQYKIAGSGTWRNCSSKTLGYNGPTLGVEATPERNGFRYRCIVTAGNGETATSGDALLTVKSSVAEIIRDPEDHTAPEGVTILLYIQATGKGLSYQWQYKIAGTGTWRNCSSKFIGYNSPDLYVEATAARNGFAYRCVVTDQDGNVAKSKGATLTVIIPELEITSDPSDVTVSEGSTAYFAVSAYGFGLSYKWQYKIAGTSSWRDCSSSFSGYHSEELAVPATAARNGFAYRCVVTDQYGNTEKSAGAVLTVS